MVNNEVSTSVITDENRFENYLEEANPAYKQAREQYNTLIKQTLNPLINNGLSGDRLGFIIILLEKILKNTETLFEENKIIKGQIDIIEHNIFQIKNESLDPIIQAGNNINTALRRFEEGFRDWNIKFDTWNIGFKDFEEKLSVTNKYIKELSEYWVGKTEQIQSNLYRIEHHIAQSNDEAIRINNTIHDLEKRFFNFEHRQAELLAPKQTFTAESVTKETQKYKILPNTNHKWKL